MISDDLPLSRAAVDRTAVARGDDGLITRARAERSTRVLLVRDGSVVTHVPADGTDAAAGEGWGRRVGVDVAVAYLDPETADAVARAAGTDEEPGDDGWLFLGRGADGGDLLARRVRPEHSAPRSGASSDVLVHRPTAGSGAAAEAAAAAGTESEAPGRVRAPLPGLRWTSLRVVGAELTDADAGLATTAVALDAWHARHPRCPRCGAPTHTTAAGWTRRCTVDGSEHYPRTDPAVIMAVVDGQDRLLLGHAAAWATHRFSTLAGFVEAGESVEHAVRREVAEETAVLVGDVEYVGSQPWPFPASLMLGFRARALSTDVVVDGVELTDARWFSREELADAVRTGDVVLPSPASIAHALVQDWYGGPVPTAD